MAARDAPLKVPQAPEALGSSEALGRCFACVTFKDNETVYSILALAGPGVIHLGHDGHGRWPVATPATIIPQCCVKNTAPFFLTPEHMTSVKDIPFTWVACAGCGKRASRCRHRKKCHSVARCKFCHCGAEDEPDLQNPRAVIIDGYPTTDDRKDTDVPRFLSLEAMTSLEGFSAAGPVGPETIRLWAICGGCGRRATPCRHQEKCNVKRCKFCHCVSQ